ncbi:DUF4276 family protein [Capnocytophaga leadbetteri]|uniref:DUF4276 family protein n=1 Tax=Capnocytophaga leadbetteri TaxID=327575 RepID=UPI0026ECCF7E|nr:DUF4276 family protein [Capnocytophaga leadbetteri]
MKTVIIICEGPTEEVFCSNLLSQYLQNSCRIEIRLLGGNCNWQRIKDMVEKALKQQKNALVTTFFDYYGVKTKKFPNWKETVGINKANVRERIEILESGMLEEIDSNLRYRFIPYVQLHEFEALLFNNIEVFDEMFEFEQYDRAELLNIFNEFPDPEMIDQGTETSPSHRLIKIIPAYRKVIQGNAIAEKIGIEQIRQKNKHFNDWIEQLIK